MTWLVVILGLALLVFLHELGHFTVARVVGIRPRAFYVGFPPAIVKVERKGIEYGIGAIPLGGFVRLPGMLRPAASEFEAQVSAAAQEDRSLVAPANTVERRLEADDFEGARAAVQPLKTVLGQADLSPGARRAADSAVRTVEEGCGADAYWRQPVWKRIAVSAAGPLTNVLVAFLIFLAVYATGAPSSTPSTRVAQVEADTPAAAAGLRPGDRIVAVDGRRTRTFEQTSRAIQASRGRPTTVTVDRGSSRRTLGPRRTLRRHGRWIWGFVPATELVSHPVGESARLAGRDCWLVVTGTIASFGGLFSAGGSTHVSGPVGVVRTSEQFLHVGLAWYLQLLGLISMSLALFNLLPLLPLDGGYIFFSLVEGARRRALPRRVYERVSQFGMALVLFVTLLAFLNDVGAGKS